MNKTNIFLKVILLHLGYWNKDHEGEQLEWLARWENIIRNGPAWIEWWKLMPFNLQTEINMPLCRVRRWHGSWYFDIFWFQRVNSKLSKMIPQPPTQPDSLHQSMDFPHTGGERSMKCGEPGQSQVQEPRYSIENRRSKLSWPIFYLWESFPVFRVLLFLNELWCVTVVRELWVPRWLR